MEFEKFGLFLNELVSRAKEGDDKSMGLINAGSEQFVVVVMRQTKLYTKEDIAKMAEEGAQRFEVRDGKG